MKKWLGMFISAVLIAASATVSFAQAVESDPDLPTGLGGEIDKEAYLKARADSLRAAGVEGIDRVLAAQQLSALIAPTMAPAMPSILIPASRTHRTSFGVAILRVCWRSIGRMALNPKPRPVTGMLSPTR